MRLPTGLLLIIIALLSVNSNATDGLNVAKAIALQKLADYGNAEAFFPTFPFKKEDAALEHEFVLAFEQSSEGYKSHFLVFSSNIHSRSGKYHINDCRACGAKLSIFEFRETTKGTAWLLEMEDITFSETGSMGTLNKDSIRIIYTGCNRYSILLKDGGSMGGGAWSVARLYAKTGGAFRDVFTTHTVYDFPINMDLEHERIAWEANLEMDETQDKEFFDIVLEIDESQYTEDYMPSKPNVIKHHSTCQRRYVFNGDEYEPGDFEEPGDSFLGRYPCSWKRKRAKVQHKNTTEAHIKSIYIRKNSPAANMISSP